MPNTHYRFHTSSSYIAPTQIQGSSLVLYTGAAGNTFPGANEHFGFSVRGPSSPMYCTSGILTSLLGRGFIVFPASNQIAFENFTTNCRGPVSGVVEGTRRAINFASYKSYFIEVWANNYNIWYSIERWGLDQEGFYTWLPHASGDCRSQALPSEAFKCGRHPEENGTEKQTFAAHTNATPSWSVTNWYID